MLGWIIRAFVYERIIDHLFNSANIQKANNETFKNTLIYGSGISYVGWVRKAREVEVILSTKETEKETRDKIQETREKIRYVSLLLVAIKSQESVPVFTDTVIHSNGQ